MPKIRRHQKKTVRTNIAKRLTEGMHRQDAIALALSFDKREKKKAPGVDMAIYPDDYPELFKSDK